MGEQGFLGTSIAAEKGGIGGTFKDEAIVLEEQTYGVQTYPDAKYCDKFFKVRNPKISLLKRYFQFYFKSVSMGLCMKKPAKMVWFTMADTAPFTISAATIGP